MSDLPPKQVNSFALLHTAPRRKVIGVDGKKLPGKIEADYHLVFCEVEGDVAHLSLTKEMDVEESQKVVVHGIELEKRKKEGNKYFVCWIEQRKVQLPSMAIIGEPYLWDPCPSCKKHTLPAFNIVKKGNLTVSLEHCEECHSDDLVDYTFLPHVRNAWGKNPRTLEGKVASFRSNDNGLLFYKHDDWQSGCKHHFNLLKWSELEAGNFTGIGSPVELPKEVWNKYDKLKCFLLNQQDQVCAIWYNGSLILDGKYAEIMDLGNGDWVSISELKSRKNRYVVAGHFGEAPHYTHILKLIDSQAQVLSKLETDHKVGKVGSVHQLGSSTLVIHFQRLLTVVSVKRDKLLLIANSLTYLQGSNNLCFIAGPNHKKALNLQVGDKIASIKLKYHHK